MSKEELVEVTVKVPKAFVDDTTKRRWFKYYRGLEEFTMEALRRLKESWMRAYAK